MKRSIQVLLVLLSLLVFASVAGAAPAAQEDDGVPYTVQPGDGLIKLARLFYGDGAMFQSIVDATNEKAATDDSYSTISDANIILVGQRLWIVGLSELPEEMEMAETEDEAEASMETAEDAAANADAAAGAETDETAADETTGEASTGFEATADLAGTGWTMTSLDGQPPVEGTTVYLNFDTAAEASGNSGCNGFGGTYETDGFHIEFGPLIGTMLACLDEGVMEQETAFRNALEDAAFYDMSTTGSLRLYDAGSTMLVEFAPANTSLAGTSWDVVSYNNGNEAVVSVVEETELTAVFEADQVSGSAGCNSYFGSYSADEGAIEIGPLAATRRTCAGEGVAEQEAEFLAALESAATYSINGDRLEMRTAEDALAVVLFAQ
jgi:heat shock protein HslJ